MKIIELRDEWSSLSTLLDQVLELPDEKRPAWFASLSALDVQYRATLIELLGRNRLELIDEMPVFQLPKGADREDHSGAAAGQLVGPYRLIELLGHGGMGSVWLAERADAQPRRKVALKLPHLGWGSGMMARIARERDILASLEHPNIARLYDAGVDQRGRPYLALEYVDGVPIDEYCETHRLALDERLRLLLLAAAAVSYAHTRLVVHRDLKPSNILVTQSGDVRLLDFGIAKLIQDDADEVTHVAGRALTPDYSSPEQIHGQPIGTPSDVYSFGVVAYELLTHVRPYRLKDLHTASLSEAILQVEAALPSRAAVSPTLRRQLRGDLDAILNKALKKDPAQRYPTVSSFAADLERYLEHSPVTARPDDFVYRWRKFIARNAVQAAAAAVVICAILVGATAALWQAHQARAEAARADATKNFLLSVFRANDPHIASDKPRGEITARELLDLGAPRIEKEFAGQPELQIELLGLTADIYDSLADEERYAAVQKRRMELARAYYGSAHPIVIAGLLEEADAACVRQDFVKADRLLAEVDGLLKTSGLDHSVARADWWRTKARVYGALAGGQPKRAYAMGQALALYAEMAPLSNNYATALNMAARDFSERGEHLKARQLLEQALAVAEAAPQRDDALMANLFINLARKQENLGEFVAAEDTYQRAEDMARKTYGEHDPNFWLSLAYHARLLHQRGQRAHADALFAQMLQTIPQTWRRDVSDKWAREIYAECMAADGRAGDAVPLLEAALRSYLAQVLYEYDVREVRRKLGDAYDRVGRTADARQSLRAARDECLAKDGPTSQWTLRSQERWGRFLLDHSRPGDADFAAAAAEFQTVVARAAGRPLLEAALAHAGLARIASQQGDTPHALIESNQAVALLTKVQGLYDLRAQPQVWLVHSAVLFKSGDTAAARTWAEKALEVSLRYDEPSSPAIAEARAAARLAAPRGTKGTLAASFCGPTSSSGSCN